MTGLSRRGRSAPGPLAPPGTPLYVEASPLLSPHLTGVGRFVARLLEALAPLTPMRLISMSPRRQARRTCPGTHLHAGSEVIFPADDLPGPRGDLQGWVGRLLALPGRPHDAELARRCPVLYTWLRPEARQFRRELCVFYDFTPLVLPWAHLPEVGGWFRHFFSRTAPLCDRAFAISDSTRHDAAWMSGFPEGDVVVGYPGPSQCLGGHAFGGDVERRNDLVLVVSTLEPRKNGPFVYEWFRDTGVLPAGAELWWVGPRGWLTREADLERRAAGRSGRRVRFLGVVSDEELCRLYRRAAFTIYPSLYEGFGFPVLDSLWHGTPVACSFNSSLQEFATPGVFYFDPGDPGSLDDACRELLGARPVGVDLADLRERFSWPALARAVVAEAFARPGAAEAA